MCSTAVASGCEMCETRCLPPTRSTHYTFIVTFILTVFALHYSNLQNRKCNQAQLDCSQSVWETHFSWDQVPDKAVLTWQFTSVLFSKHDRCSFLTFSEFFFYFLIEQWGCWRHISHLWQLKLHRGIAPIQIGITRGQAGASLRERHNISTTLSQSGSSINDFFFQCFKLKF